MTKAKPLIEVRNLQVDFNLFEGTVHALDGVDFDIPHGKSLGVIGESGCGKSVTAQSIMRIVPAPPGKIIGGEILLHLDADAPRPNGNGKVRPTSVQGGEAMGENPSVLPSPEAVAARHGSNAINILNLSANGEEMRAIRWKEIGMIFQEPMTSFSPLYTIGQQIIEGILLHMPGETKKSARGRAIDMLGHVGIPQPKRLVDVYPHQLSGGMRQRAMIAMAISCNPKLLIADEPTTALDVTIEAQILELLQKLQAEMGMSMMYISHDLAVVGEMSDEVMVMYLGRVMERATTEELFANPLHPYTQALWRSIPRIEDDQDRLVPISGTLPNPFVQQRGCPFASRCEHRIQGLCDPQRPPMYSITPTHQVSCFLYEDQAKNVAQGAAQGAAQVGTPNTVAGTVANPVQ